MTPEEKAWAVVDFMYHNDPFSMWLGIDRVAHGPGSCVLSMKVRQEMLNGFDIGHGGITYSLSDSALAFASNSHGRKCVSVETSISHTNPIKQGDTLTATAKEKSITNKIGIYEVEVVNQQGTIVSLFRGTVYRTSQEWELKTDKE